MLFLDRLQNFVSGLGTAKDKRVGNAFVFQQIDPAQLVAMHRSDWMARKVVDIIPDDMTREWREWKADEAIVEAIEKVERAPQINIQAKVNEALQLARLRGGSILVLGVDVGSPEDELVVERVGKDTLKYVHVLGRDQVSHTDINRDITSPYYGEPTMWEFTGKNGQMVRIHPSRVIKFIGAPILDKSAAPDEIWGDSILQVVYDALQNAASSQEHTASLIPEAKTDVIYIPSLSKYLENEKTTQKLTERFTYANTMKSMFNMLLLEGDGNGAGEKWEQKTINFGQFPELLRQYLQVASGAADIPMVRFLQDAPSGLGSNGEVTLKNYYDRIGADQRNDLSPALWRFDEIAIRSATGSRDPKIYYEWAPLYSQTEKERAEVFKLNAEAARAIVGSGTGQELITREAVSKSLISRIEEDGNLPGLAAAVEEYGDLEENEPTEEELAAAAATQAANTNNVTRMQQAANDAAPRALYVRRDVLNRADIVKWATAQGFTDIVPDLHVTIAYSTQPVDWFAVGESWSPKLEISAGGPRQMETLGDGGKYKALLISASELVWRHKAIIEAGASWSGPEYQPHISIQIGGDIDLSKVEPYQGKIILGPEIFEELKDE
ncbi:anti-CBASS protein Acb1 family protein [Agrobacterium radiobacter]|uniref:Anti-CBASS protein Acb1 n=1 Tax=Agrobacterium tumefaciens str. B6 TaxID=1183423 RepID=A0A822UZ08_AGRTU|nr:anti-CBASS Acb1 family protein [Agrobacterium tumefaciens]KWT88008.1 hypothetical protein ASB65_18400 [Agrobacterium tumefaciens str. B6]MQB28198.1 DUF1073 domain-containing protein [Agrobacterium tumefaciens]NTA04996.1 DUF1073 domain-containing protein [Agrobacterium tumefaciens]NTA91591.1 DUF1073 domain-containing protein [Agrobacterium tumefaciens]NTB12741.1 DUF1073 domain-containing protein [Agrobacterium tumefaciens]